jgi:hypothetical protein
MTERQNFGKEHPKHVKVLPREALCGGAWAMRLGVDRDKGGLVIYAWHCTSTWTRPLLPSTERRAMEGISY